jgi:hypothetical protein
MASTAFSVLIRIGRRRFFGVDEVVTEVDEFECVRDRRLYLEDID